MSELFSAFGLRPELLQAIDKAGFSAPRPIQQAALPAIIEGKDVLAQAQTGSGKTLAFAAGSLQILDVSLNALQTLVLCPTRELAEQVAEQYRLLAKDLPNVKVLTLCGGQPMGPQINSLKHGCHIIVGTSAGQPTCNSGLVNSCLLFSIAFRLVWQCCTRRMPVFLL